jgi:mono/diheme cytochrome c family protein
MHANDHLSKFRWPAVAAALATGLLVLAACAPMTPAAPPAAATEEATGEATAETGAAEATEAAAEEESATATEEATEEPTEEAAEEAAEGATAEATEEPTEEPVEEGGTAGSVATIGDPTRGGYIFATTTGCGCHFNRDLSAPAGGNKFEGPFGVVYAPNITSDPETGIGNWTDEEIVNALRLGHAPDGKQLHPIMPYRDWSVMADQDAYDLVAALRTLPPVANEVPENELANPVPPFTPVSAPAATAPTEGVERGEYLVALARCNGCHTPRTETGAPDTTRLLAGATVMDDIAPNLTPDESAGLGGIPDDDIVHFLMTGEYDDGSVVEGPMERVIENGTSKLTEEDVRAIVAYLRSIPPVAEQPQ